MVNSRQKLQALFGVLLLVTVGPVSGMMTGTGTAPLQTAGNDTTENQSGAVGNQAVASVGNEPTQTPVSTAGNQPASPLSTSWNSSTEPTPNAVDDLVSRENDSQPYPIVGDQQPTDPDGDGLYEDINGDGAVNIVDVDALYRHLSATEVGANWSAYDYRGDNQTDIGDIQFFFTQTRGLSVQDSDGDGLPDSYEENVTNTNPDETDTDGDGTIDGLEDWDNDTLSAYDEYRIGTDPYDTDTDGDGLSDDVESEITGVSPTAADTDGDGVLDPQEDADNDSLIVRNETLTGTEIGNPDTDGDGLTDGEEVHRYGTNATLADTDQDGLDDGEEIRLGTDPLDPDTNDNGVQDGNESYKTDTSDDELGVDLNLTGQGDIANGTTIDRQDDPMFNSSRVDNMSRSPVVELSSERNFSSANVTIQYNDTGLENESEEVAIFTYDPEMGIFMPLNSTVDTANNTVTAETSHFSTFAVYDIDNWATTYSAEEPQRETNDDGVVPVDVSLVMDTSGSMGGEEALRNRAGQRFVSGLLGVDRASVVDFDSSATVVQGLTTDFTAVNNTLDDLGSYGGTSIGNGVRTANQDFARNSNDSRAQVMILLTDGRGSGGRAEAREAAEQNTTIYTVGFGGANSGKLRDIADITGGTFYDVEDANDLPEVFSRIADNTTDISDPDGDGLSTELELSETTIGGPDGETVVTDPNVSDTDDDGLSDSQELGEFIRVDDDYPWRSGSNGDGDLEIDPRYSETLQELVDDDQNGEAENLSYYRPVSDPTDPDTDGDGLIDSAEVNEFGTDPLDSDTDDDGLDDSEDPEPLTNTGPPQIDINRANTDEIYLDITDDGSVTVTGEVHYGSLDPRAVENPRDQLLQETASLTGTRTDTDGDEETFRVDIPESDSGYFSQTEVVGYTITVVDEDGNEVQMSFGRRSVTESDAQLASATVVEADQSGGETEYTINPAVGNTDAQESGNELVEAVGATAFVGASRTPQGLLGIVAIVLAGLGLQGIADELSPTSVSTISAEAVNVPESAQAQEPVAETVIGGSTVTLIEGSHTLENGQPVGQGMAYISATSTLSQSDVESAMQNSKWTQQQGGSRVIIGPGENGGKIVVLVAVSGVVHSGTTLVSSSAIDPQQNSDIDWSPSDLDQAASEGTVEATGGGSSDGDGDDDSGPEGLFIPNWVTNALITAAVVDQVAPDVFSDVYSDVGDKEAENDDDDRRRRDSDELRTTHIDMGKGESILFRAPGEGRSESLLVDAGSNRRSSRWSEHYRQDLVSRLEQDSDGDYVIDHLVMSHNDTDHISYVDEILADDDIEVRNLYYNGLEADNTHEEGIDEEITQSTETQALREGDTIVFGEASVNVWNPEPGLAEDADLNANSIVLEVQHQDTAVLTTGDVQSETESELATEHGTALSDVDILTASHHGTSGATESVVTEQFLDATVPDDIVISNKNDGPQNREFAPDCAVFDNISSSTDVYWSAIHGDVTHLGSDLYLVDDNSEMTQASALQDELPYSCESG